MSDRKSLDTDSTVDVTDSLLEKQFIHGSEHYEQPKQWRSHLPSRLAIAIHTSLLACYLLVFVFGFSMPKKQEHGPDYTYSPAQASVTWQRQWIDFEVFTDSPYRGNSTEADDAWDDLFAYYNIRVTGEELARMNITSVQLNDGSGDYLAALDVLHQLHCLKLLHKFIHGKEIAHAEKVSKIGHLDHCIDAVRQELMCRAEVNFLTYSWRPDLSFPWATLSYPHTCVNWDNIMQWAKTRYVDIFQKDILVNPLTRNAPITNVHPHK